MTFQSNLNNLRRSFTATPEKSQTLPFHFFYGRRNSDDHAITKNDMRENNLENTRLETNIKTKFILFAFLKQVSGSQCTLLTLLYNILLSSIMKNMNNHTVKKDFSEL